MPNLFDEHTRKGLRAHPSGAGSSANLIEVLADVTVMKGAAEYIRSKNGPEIRTRDFRESLAEVQALAHPLQHQKAAFIPGLRSPASGSCQHQLKTA